MKFIFFICLICGHCKHNQLANGLVVPDGEYTDTYVSRAVGHQITRVFVTPLIVLLHSTIQRHITASSTLRGYPRGRILAAAAAAASAAQSAGRRPKVGSEGDPCGCSRFQHAGSCYSGFTDYNRF